MLIPLRNSGYNRDGTRLLFLDGGGDAAPASPTSSTVTQSNIPEYARPYMESLLGRSQALSTTPYQTYSGERVAGQTALQQNAAQNAAQLRPSELLDTAAQATSVVGGRALTLGDYQPTAFGAEKWNAPGVAQSYMSPYVQQALTPTLEENARQSAIQGQGQQAQATQAGAFGGYREALQRSERERNLGFLQRDTIGKGLSQAYEQSAGQFQSDAARQAQSAQAGEQSRQFGADYGLRGLSTAASAADQLGRLGSETFSQQQKAIDTQSRLGTQEQQTNQMGLTQAYTDFQNQQNAPYKALGFESDILRGVPGTQSASQVYSAPPSGLSQVAGLGTLAYGLSKKKGGVIDVKEKVKKPKAAGLADLALAKIKGNARA